MPLVWIRDQRLMASAPQSAETDCRTVWDQASGPNHCPQGTGLSGRYRLQTRTALRIRERPIPDDVHLAAPDLSRLAAGPPWWVEGAAESRFGMLLLVPALTAFGLVVLYPFLKALSLSFYEASLAHPEDRIRRAGQFPQSAGRHPGCRAPL